MKEMFDPLIRVVVSALGSVFICSYFGVQHLSNEWFKFIAWAICFFLFLYITGYEK
jgi:ABC-type multidrug transport system permease subunit